MSTHISKEGELLVVGEIRDAVLERIADERAAKINHVDPEKMTEVGRKIQATKDRAAIDSTVVADGGGLRYNEGKNQLELIPPEWIWGLAMVLTRGAVKYATRNWERGMKWSYPVGCALRHLLKFVCGERYDVESGNHHLAMAAWNCLALMSYDIRQIGENDLEGVGNVAWMDATAQEPGPALIKLMQAKAAATAGVLQKK